MKSLKKISVSTLLRKAKNYQKVGSTPDAILCYETILSHYPNNQKAKICLDRLNRSSGIKTPALNPPNQNILQIETYLNKKEYEKAEDTLHNLKEDIGILPFVMINDDVGFTGFPSTETEYKILEYINAIN